MMEKKVDPESCGQLQSAMFKQKEASALRIYRSLKAGRIKRERSTYLAIKVPNANWPQSKRKLCFPFKRCDSFIFFSSLDPNWRGVGGPGLSNPDIAKRGVGLTHVKSFGGCEKVLKVIMAP